MKHQILVTVKGGMIENIYATSKDVQISVCDHDIQEEDCSKLVYYKAEADFIVTPEVLDNSLRAIIGGKELPQFPEENQNYIVIDAFNGTYNICTDEEGETKVFDNLADAEAEAADCQDGIVVPL